MAVVLPAFVSTSSITGATLISNADEQLNIFMNDVESYMTTSFDAASTQISNEVSSNITNTSVTASRSTATFTTVASTWYRIATSALGIGSNSGVFVINWSSSNNSGTIRLDAGCVYGSTASTTISQIGYSKLGVSGPSQARIVYNTTPTGNFAYIDVLVPSVITNMVFNIELQDTIGWTLVAPTIGTVPSGYTVFTYVFGTTTVPDAHNHTSLTGITNLAFDLANVSTANAGQLVWNSAEETLDLGLDGEVALQVGQELLVRGKNTTGVTIPNGRVLMATGAVGNSGVISIGLHDGVQATGYKIAGIATEDISNNEIGFSLLRGKLRGINCTGTPFGEVWSNGDGLWVSPNGGGALTHTEPSVGQLKMFVGVVINNAVNGTIQVRTNGIDENHYVEYVGTIPLFEGALI